MGGVDTLQYVFFFAAHTTQQYQVHLDKFYHSQCLK